MNLNTKLYSELKVKGYVTITRIGKDQYAFVLKQWNPNTGEQVDDAIDVFSLPKLETMIGETNAQLQGMLEILHDVQKVTTKTE